ncbi:MAG TPA: membrane protein insertase YidC [Steroidobacteraceae bacterium]|nr:membrane protein insertase YidC [Steroidobacteraceae bacterium]
MPNLNLRLTLWLALGAILYYNYITWQQDYRPVPQLTAQGASGAAGASSALGNTVPKPAGAAVPAAVPPATPPASTSGATGAAGTAGATGASGAAGPLNAAAGEAPAGTVHVVTDVLDLTISLRGGEIERADLPTYPLHKNVPNVPVRLENDEPGSLYLLQTGLAGVDDQAAPTHLAILSAAQSSYTLAAGARVLRVPLTWTDGHGLTVTKTFVFTRGRYAVDLQYQVHNESASPREVAAYGQILRHWEHASRSYFDVETYSFKGPAVFDGTKSHDLKVENETDSKFSESITNGWLASLQHHFVSAIVPAANQPYHYQLRVEDHQYLMSATGPFEQIAPGGSAEIGMKLFIGPKLQSQLAATGPRLDLAADYGLLTVIAHPLFMALSWVHGVTGNWGWSIIIVTALIKLIFYPLSQASGRSMAKMRAVAPRMKQIQETFKDDREKLGRAMMELYKREKINPLAGCLPMVVQIPVFISFYWVLVESVEMRQAPFMLWINDLSVHDPYFVLPLLMGGAMFAQFKLNPAPPDPMQARIMQFMPLVMTFTMAWFPSGLVLYWLTNTVLSIVQQWRINQVVQAASKPRS